MNYAWELPGAYFLIYIYEKISMRVVTLAGCTGGEGVGGEGAGGQKPAALNSSDRLKPELE